MTNVKFFLIILSFGIFSVSPAFSQTASLIDNDIPGGKFVFGAGRAWMIGYLSDDDPYDGDEYFIIEGHNRLSLAAGYLWNAGDGIIGGLEVHYEQFEAELANFDHSEIGMLKGWNISLHLSAYMHFSRGYGYLGIASVSYNAGKIDINEDMYDLWYVDDDMRYLVREIEYDNNIGFSCFSFGGYFRLIGGLHIGLESTLIEIERPRIIFKTYVEEKSEFKEKVRPMYFFMPTRAMLKVIF